MHTNSSEGQGRGQSNPRGTQKRTVRDIRDADGEKATTGNDKREIWSRKGKSKRAKGPLQKLMRESTGRKGEFLAACALSLKCPVRPHPAARTLCLLCADAVGLCPG